MWWGKAMHFDIELLSAVIGQKSHYGFPLCEDSSWQSHASQKSYQVKFG